MACRLEALRDLLHQHRGLARMRRPQRSRSKPSEAVRDLLHQHRGLARMRRARSQRSGHLGPSRAISSHLGPLGSIQVTLYEVHCVGTLMCDTWSAPPDVVTHDQ